jgi:hypothetical protein
MTSKAMATEPVASSNPRVWPAINATLGSLEGFPSRSMGRAIAPLKSLQKFRVGGSASELGENL